LKTDIEIGKEKKKQMLKALTTSLRISRSFEELINNMKKLGYRVTLSQNEKVGISGMRIVKFEDINHQTEREYKPGYKLSEITNTLKIKDIKQKLQENNERTIVFNSTATEQINKDEKRDSTSVSKQLENIAKELLKPSYTSSPEDELLKKKKRKFR
jgi:organic radical activating enzyme